MQAPPAEAAGSCTSCTGGSAVASSGLPEQPARASSAAAAPSAMRRERTCVLPNNSGHTVLCAEAVTKGRPVKNVHGFPPQVGSGTVEIRTVTTASATAGATPGQVAGREHEETGLRIEIAGLTGREGGGMGGEDLGPAGMVGGEPAGMRL